MKKTSLIVVLVVALVTAIASHYLTRIYVDQASHDSDDNKPLYWVAPMDPSYRRDMPGKSPMGMDLVPVYDEAGNANDSAPGTITISPDVVNNLGVRTAIAEMRPMHTEIITVGYVQYDQDQLVHVHPRVEGWIEKLYVKAAGDPVVKGEPLYALYSPQLVNAQEELLLALKLNNSRLVQAAENRLRALQISDTVISQLKRDRVVKQSLTFYVPKTGVVDNLNIREGFFVKPGNTLMSVGNLNDVWVEAEIFERQAALVKVGLPVTMTLDYLPEKRWQGKVNYVYPALDAKTRTARVRLRFANIDGLLKPNMFAQVAIHADAEEHAFLIPREAVIRTGKQDRVVLALGDGRYKSIAVVLGRLGDDYAEISSGLSIGQRVVTSAQFLLDSESSKTSDFKRLHHGVDRPGEGTESATVEGVINQIDHSVRSLNISREAIKKWNRPAATMDFSVDEKLDLVNLQRGMRISFTFKVEGDDFVVVSITRLKPQADPQLSSDQLQTIGPGINHD